MRREPPLGLQASVQSAFTSFPSQISTKSFCWRGESGCKRRRSSTPSPSTPPSTCLCRRVGNLGMLVLDANSKINWKLNKLPFRRNLLQAFKELLFAPPTTHHPPPLDKQHPAPASADMGLLIKEPSLDVCAAAAPRAPPQGFDPPQAILAVLAAPSDKRLFSSPPLGFDASHQPGNAQTFSLIKN